MATRSGARIIIEIEAVSSDATAGINGATSDLRRRYELQWSQGTSAGNVDKVYQDELTVSTTPTDLDLAGGSNVKDPASQDDQTFSKLHAIIVKNSDSTNDVTIGGDAAGVPIFDDTSDAVTLAPGEVFVWTAASGTDGVDVTATTGDIIQIAGSAADTQVEITLIGR